MITPTSRMTKQPYASVRRQPVIFAIPPCLFSDAVSPRTLSAISEGERDGIRVIIITELLSKRQLRGYTVKAENGLVTPVSRVSAS